MLTDGVSRVGVVTDRDLVRRVLAGESNPTDQTARDAMSTDPCTVDPDARCYEAADVMSENGGENGVRRLPICDEEDDLVGIITWT